MGIHGIHGIYGIHKCMPCRCLWQLKVGGQQLTGHASTPAPGHHRLGFRGPGMQPSSGHIAPSLAGCLQHLWPHTQPARPHLHQSASKRVAPLAYCRPQAACAPLRPAPPRHGVLPAPQPPGRRTAQRGGEDARA